MSTASPHIPTWKNLQADIETASHPNTIQDFLRLVVAPSLANLDARILQAHQSQAAAAPFEIADLEDLMQETLRGYALALQSLWERQFRNHVAACAEETGLSSTSAAHAADWAKLKAMFASLRGVPMERFSSLADLDLLQLLGSVCRHGEGKAAARLRQAHPELWPWPGLQRVRDLEIRSDLIRRLAEAVIRFWEEAGDIYVNSLARKAPSAERRIREAELRWMSR